MAPLSKYFGAINIILLVGFTYLLADLISLFIGQRLEVSPSLPPVETLTSSSGQARPKLDVYRDILDRNIFNVKPVSSISESMTMESVAPVPLPALSLKLIGTVSGGPKHSFAVIQDLTTKEEHLYRLGDPVAQDGKLIKISRDQVVVLRPGGLRETLQVNWSPETKKRASRSKPPKPGKKPVISSTAGQTEFILDRQEVTEALQNLPQLMTKARIIPHINKDGKSDGFRVVSIRPGSFYQRIGLQNGDVIQQINGIEIKDPRIFMSVFNQIKNETNITLDLVRKNQKQTFSYEIR